MSDPTPTPPARPAAAPQLQALAQENRQLLARHIGGQQLEGKARLSGRDTGIGIPGKLLGNLFDTFNPTRRAGLQGETTTGLGLFIARQIVQLHGGDIWVESRERVGTCFFIELPGGRSQPGS